jgi:hypothetical protein
MALFTDGPISNIEDLHGYDTQLTEVANVEGIDVTRKLAQAQEEITIEVTALLRRMAGGDAGDVVVTSPLKLWHTFRTLEMVYRDAYHSQLNDRYASKRDEYHEMSKWAHEKVMQSGLGMTADPIPRAGIPLVAPATGALADGTYYVGMSWCNERGEEGACSPPAKITIAGSTFEVEPWAPPVNATGWNVYAGVGPAEMVRQNGAAVGLGAKWTQPDALADGMAAGSGQAVGYVQAIARLIERG